jgi:hypothetical protein
MSEKFLQVRVRPARVAVLINKAGANNDLMLAFELLSRLWGGRFSQIHAVDAAECDRLTEFRLASSRPEFVYGIGIDENAWREATRLACQPRGYGSLDSEFVQKLHERRPRVEDFILVDTALRHLIKTRDDRPGRKRVLELVSPEAQSPWAAYCAAMYGVHYPNVGSEYYDKKTCFTEGTTEAFVTLATTFAKDAQQSWLDVTGHQLSLRLAGFATLAPTVVLVGSLVSDLTLFWNLRASADADHAAWIIPLPAEGEVGRTVFEKLREWLLAFHIYGAQPNYCVVTSQTVGEAACRAFADQFREELSGSPIEFVDYDTPRFQLPTPIPYEYESLWPATKKGRRLTIQPPRPKAFGELIPKGSWYVDVVKDVATGRALEELHVPPGAAVFEVLNSPCPPGIGFESIARAGDGIDSINLRCQGRQELINFYLPTAQEILEEIIREHGYEPVHDEKRSSYMPVIKRFGGLHPAAAAFSGMSGAVLSALQDDAKTYDEIAGTCRIGAGDLPGESFLQRIGEPLRHLPNRMERVGLNRFKKYARIRLPENQKVQSLLEHWADRAIIRRSWQLGPCLRCHQTFFERRLDIQKRNRCPACGNPIKLSKHVTLGYALDRTVKTAVNEGIIPVVLTGRFLRNMTNDGFLWLPGIKYQCGGRSGDIDILASCDGALVFCECKRLGHTASSAPAWGSVETQFLETAEVAKKCGGALVVLAALVDEFPGEVVERIRGALGNSIPHLLLNKHDLEKGYRTKPSDKHFPRLNLRDLIPNPFPELPRPVTVGKARTINFGWGVLTRG